MTALAATIIFAAFVGLAPLSLSAAAPTDVVVIAPGEDIQALVDANLPGTSYLLLTGIHHLQSVEPKDGDSFTGERGAAMSGAVELGPIERRDQHWSAPAPRQRGNAPPALMALTAIPALILRTYLSNQSRSDGLPIRLRSVPAHGISIMTRKW